MSIFGTIMDKIFHSADAKSTDAPTGTPTGSAPTGSTPAGAARPASSDAPATQTAQLVDVEAVLIQSAATKGDGGNWQTSIVDLLKLLDLDSSLSARKELAAELNVHAGADGTAEQNIAIHKAVMQKLADNGGKVPDSMKG